MLTRSDTQPALDEIHDQWKWFVALGVVMIILGAVILWNVVDATLITTILVGFLLVAAGIAEIVAAFGQGRSVASRLLHGLLGVIYILVGLNIVTDPFAGTIALTLVIAAMLIVDGIIRLVEAFAYRPPAWGLMGVVAIVNILLGLWLWSGIPVSGLAIGFFVGIQIVMAGVMWFVLGWMARAAGGPTTGDSMELPRQTS